MPPPASLSQTTWHVHTLTLSNFLLSLSLSHTHTHRKESKKERKKEREREREREGGGGGGGGWQNGPSQRWFFLKNVSAWKLYENQASDIEETLMKVSGPRRVLWEEMKTAQIESNQPPGHGSGTIQRWTKSGGQTLLLHVRVFKNNTMSFFSKKMGCLQFFCKI